MEHVETSQHPNQVKLAEAFHEIEKAKSQLFRQDILLRDISQRIMMMGFDFVSISLINHEKEIIEVVQAEGEAEDWRHYARHHLSREYRRSDIHADIVLTKYTEVISEWDDRFDPWIYKIFLHDRLSRIFTPILLAREVHTGKIIPDWWQKSTSWEPIAISGSNTSYKIEGMNDSIRIETIGTIEAGYLSKTSITYSEVNTLNNALAGIALELYQCLLPSFLEKVMTVARQIVNADSATLHFPLDMIGTQYIHQFCCGAKIGLPFLSNFPPRMGGIGKMALSKSSPQCIPDKREDHDLQELRRVNAELFSMGIHALACFPLKARGREGLLYIHSHRPRYFTESEIEQVKWLADHATDAIRHTIAFIERQEKLQRLNALHALSILLSEEPEKETLLDRIAWSARSLMVADIVTIYEYIESKRCFQTPPCIAGKLLSPDCFERKVQPNDPPALLIQFGKDYYADACRFDSILDPNDGEQVGFVSHEYIRSSAGLLLKVGTQVVGVMFVNFRRFHVFTDEEKQLMETIAVSAAIAIRNRRQLNRMQLLSKAENTVLLPLKLNEILEGIIKLTEEILDAQRSLIILVDPSKRKCLTKIGPTYPPSYIEALDFEEIEDGISGYVLKTRSSHITDDASNDPNNKGIAWQNAQTHGTGPLIVVPLKVKEGIIGTLTAARQRGEACFRQEDLSIAIMLGNKAAMAIEKAQLFKHVDMVRNQAKVVAEATLLKAHEKTLASIVEGTKDVFECDAVTLYTYNDQSGQFNYPPTMTGVENESKVTELGRVTPGSVVTRILYRGEMVINEDIRDGDLLKGPFADRERIRSAVAIPLEVQENDPKGVPKKLKVGLMFVNYRTPHHFSENEKDTLDLFANQAAIAIRNDQLYDELKQTKDYISSTLAAAWMGMTADIWHHQTLKKARTIRYNLTQLEEQCLTQRSRKEFNALVKDIYEIADELAEQPQKTSIPGVDPPEPLPVKRLLQETIDTVARAKHYSDISLILPNHQNDDIFIEAHKESFFQMMQLILDNAAEAMIGSEQKKITFQVLVENNRVHILISDTGCGVPGHLIDALFVKRIEKKAHQKGSGRGLLFAKAIAMAYYGDAKMLSTGPKGTVIRFSFPQYIETESS